MSMERRAVLKKLGVAGTLGTLAGCVGVQEQSTATQANDDNSGGGGGSDDDSGSGDSEATESEGPAGTAKVWYSLPDTEIPARKEAIEQFNSDTKHTIKGADIADLAKKTTSAIPAGQGPKLFEWAHDWVGDYSQRGFLTDQSDQLSIDLDSFTDAAAQAVQFNGNTVGLPHSAETVTLIYNKDIVDEAPESVADMRAVMDDYHDPSSSQYGLGMPFDPYFASAWLQAFGGYYFNPDKDPMLGLTKSETVKGLNFALDNFKPYMPKDPGYEAQAAVFAEGNAAFAINGPWYLATLNEKGVNYGVTKLPMPEGGEPNPYTGITMWYFSKGMEDGDASAAAARQFAEWHVTNEDRALQAAKEQGAIPVLSSLAGSDELPDEVSAFSESVAMGTPMPTHPKMNKVWSPVGSALTKVFNGDAEPAAALEQAEKEIRGNWE
ncbi:extracellular solute-binding protein [Haloarchaeobius sp. TZWSO28]|uniref:extracellular solute-binding protein n=1 Tax=Haloarchaeobius sp. TZWSO28 TaxID=3446119 RepID=UPI003EBD9C03